MHVAINASDLGRRRGGNESYLLGLLAGLATVAGGTSVRISPIVAGKGAGLLRDDPRLHGLDVIDVGGYHRLPFLFWQQTAILRRTLPDWLVSTFFLPPGVPCRAAVLIHDLSFRAHPEFFPWSIAAYMRLLTGLAIHRADIVVALSGFTKGEVLSYYPNAKGKIAVVYPGVGDEFQAEGDPTADEAVLASLEVRQPYLLAVGNIHPRKNLGRLLTAWERLRDGDQAVPNLVWAGQDRWASHELIDHARALGVQLLGFVAPDHLPALYRRAEALAYPSLYEGFGLPPLEAMACGTPALTSNGTSLPEATGDAALTVDATDVDALAEGLSQILFDDALRRELRTKGFARAAQLSWEETARGLLDALGDASAS
jgi:glycosyltransferase involved in cell wall biosynthesis